MGWILHDGSVYDYTLETLGRPVKLTRPFDGTVWADAVSYGAAGEIKSIRYRGPRYWGADVPYYLWYTETRTYNALGQLTQMQALGERDPVYAAPPAPPINFEYRYAAANDGRIAQRKDWISGEEVNYQYDTLGRLSLAETTGPEWGMRFSYDGFGNLTGETATKGTGFTTTYNHDANNRLIGGYAYDANGNMTSMPALTLTYDVENRLKQAVHTTNGTEQYAYNPWNQRVWRKPANGYETIYLYGPDGQLAVEQRVEIDSFQTLRLTTQQQELRLGGKLLRSGDGEVIEDRVGTANAKNYYPYGELKAGATASQFATYRRGASGLDYAINRYYASQVGRFTTPDPWAGSARPRVPQSWNRYAYVLGDPVNSVDPNGLARREGEGTCPSSWYGAGICDGGGGGGVGTPYYDPEYPGGPRELYPIEWGDDPVEIAGPTADGGGGRRDPCDAQDPTNARVLDFIAANRTPAEQLSAETGLSTEFLLAWSGMESLYGTGSAAKLNNNFFRLTTTGKNPTGSWLGAIPCSALPGSTHVGFACFPTDLSNESFDDGNNNMYISGVAALFSQSSRYLNAALGTQRAGGRIADVANAIAKAGFNSEPIDYGGRVAGAAGAISLRIDCPH